MVGGGAEDEVFGNFPAETLICTCLLIRKIGQGRVIQDVLTSDEGDDLSCSHVQPCIWHFL